jgi:hypothetical protein
MMFVRITTVSADLFIYAKTHPVFGVAPLAPTGSEPVLLGLAPRRVSSSVLDRPSNV